MGIFSKGFQSNKLDGWPFSPLWNLLRTIQKDRERILTDTERKTEVTETGSEAKGQKPFVIFLSCLCLTKRKKGRDAPEKSLNIVQVHIHFFILFRLFCLVPFSVTLTQKEAQISQREDIPCQRRLMTEREDFGHFLHFEGLVHLTDKVWIS